jgi:hypothetical protein
MKFLKFGKWLPSWRPYQEGCDCRDSKESRDRHELQNFQPCFLRRLPHEPR